MAATAAPAATAQDVQASGIFKDADEIDDLCRSADAADLALCDQYLMGVYDAISYFEDLKQIKNAVCVGSGAKADVLRAAFTTYIDAKPDRRKYSAVSIAYNAFFGAAFNTCAKQ